MSQTTEVKPIYDTDRKRSKALYELIQVWHYRDLIYQLIYRDVTARYKRSVLGIAWTMINPLGTMIILSVVFSHVFPSIEGYVAYVLSGLLVWNFFAQSTAAGMNSLVWGGDLFRRIYLPRTVFAISAVGTGVVNLVISLVPLLLVMLVVGVKISFSFFLVVIPIILLAAFALGVTLLLSSVGVFFPDVVEMYQIAIQAWFYLTPVLYKLDILPKGVQFWVRLNPMVYFVDIFRLSTFYGQLFSWKIFGLSAGVAALTLIAGWWVFTQVSEELAYRA